MKTVFMFSGQGAQYAGMGKELYQNYSVAKDIFDRADAVLGYSIKDICFQDEQKLGETEYAQPAILTMSIAAFKVLEEQGIRADMTAGLSLGEYSAYVASGAMDFEEAVALVQKRGRFMTEAVPSGEGAGRRSSDWIKIWSRRHVRRQRLLERDWRSLPITMRRVRS